MISDAAAADPAPVGALRPRSQHRGALHGDRPARAWSPVGTVDAGVLAHVDEAGSVQMIGSSWTLDWWIGAEDRWHHPSREASVRQRTLGRSPVVETALRVPGGDVVARAYGVFASAGDWRGPGVVVEVENLTSVPVGLAFAIRPLALDGLGALRSVRSTGPELLLDGTDRVLLSREPARVACGRLDEVADRLVAGDDESAPIEHSARADDAEVAVVVPLPHTATVRVLLPLTAARGGGRRGAPVPIAPWEAPDAASVANGWSVHGNDLGVVVPEPEWDDALAWSGRLLRLAGPDEVGAGLDRRREVPAGPSAAVRAAEVAEAMARLGASDALVPVARGLADAQRLGGEVRLGDRSDGTVALVHAVAGALAPLDPETPAVEALVAPAALAIRRLRRGRGTDEDLGPSAVRALRSLAPVMERIGQPEVAEDARTVAAAVAEESAGSEVRRVDPPGVGERSTVEAALAARALVLGGGSDAVAAVRSCWAGMAERGRSDAERVVDGEAPTPVGSLGFDVAELATRTNALLDVLVGDGAAGPALLVAFDQTWAGQPVEVHGATTPWGTTGYAVRWHGTRPALLWEIDDAAPGATESDVIVTSPGLDRTWRGDGRVGEALLAARPLPTGSAAAEEPIDPTPANGEPVAREDGAVEPVVREDGAGTGLPGEGDSFG